MCAQLAARIVRVVERERHEREVAHVRRVVVVAGPVDALGIGEERRIVLHAHRLGVVSVVIAAFSFSSAQRRKTLRIFALSSAVSVG